jgi:hypothetical protein
MPTLTNVEPYKGFGLIKKQTLYSSYQIAETLSAPFIEAIPQGRPKHVAIKLVALIGVNFNINCCV